ncbi:MAG: 2-phospho-L-lactate/phosphoenolpyruvate guanylyltransferase [Thermoleophilaceae bacterium]|nr:2-phospho-L-lactate/phosphoenolpyruvate guanylyltransferase [Thermoleophilaceae bacterium]
MRTAAILPVKSFGSAKQRLGSLLGAGSRHALAQAMFQDVLSSLRKVESIEQIVVVASEPSVEFETEEQIVLLEDDIQDGQSAAALIGIRWALDAGFDRVLMVPGDTPLLAFAEVEALLTGAEADGTAVVVVPDRHDTGTNALLLSPPTAIAPGFGPNSRDRHIAAAQAAGVSHRVERVPSLIFDVDTSEDLAVVAAAIDEQRTVAPRTRGALRQLDRAGARLHQPAGAQT